MSVVMQNSFLGKPQVSGNLRDKVRFVLSEYPHARNEYKLTIYYFWTEFDGLGEVLGEKADAFKDWLVNQATAPKTIVNRAMEVQSWRPELEASPEVEQQRQRQATQGPVL